MAVKYQCPKCDKRYADWGAQKLAFKCPDCEGEELIRMGQGALSTPTAKKKKSLKRKRKTVTKVSKAKVAVPAFTEDDLLSPNLDAVADATAAGADDFITDLSGDAKLEGEAKEDGLVSPDKDAD